MKPIRKINEYLYLMIREAGTKNKWIVYAILALINVLYFIGLAILRSGDFDVTVDGYPDCLGSE